MTLFTNVLTFLSLLLILPTTILGKFLSNYDIAGYNVTRKYSILGRHIYDGLGNSVASAGDFNGDGLNDIVIGAQNASRAYVIFGTNNYTVDLDLNGNGIHLNGTRGIEIIGGTGISFAYTVKAAGDVNGDGISDIIIGAPFGGSSASGSAYVIFGSLNPVDVDTTVVSNLFGNKGFEIVGNKSGDNIGGSCGYAGDLNGDGIDDLIITSINNSPSPSRAKAGIAYILFGKRSLWTNIDFSANNITLNGTLGFKVLGNQTTDHLGSSSHYAGDINGDGVHDLVLGANTASVGSGLVYVIYGNRTSLKDIDLSTLILNGATGFQIKGHGGEQIGSSVTFIGDVKNDGIHDFAVGSLISGISGKGMAGCAYIIFGNKTLQNDINLANTGLLNGSKGFYIYGAFINDQLTTTLNHAGDLNMDGISDFIIGTAAGRVYIIFGSNSSFIDIDLVSFPTITGDSMNGFKLLGPSSDAFGTQVSTALDFNGDGAPDIIISAKAASAYGRTKAGVVSVFMSEYSADQKPSPETDQQAQQAATVSHYTGQAADIGAGISVIFSSKDSGSMFANSLTKMLEYVKFMQIRYPPKIQAMFDKGQDLRKSGLSGVIYKATKSINGTCSARSLSGNFGIYGALGCFIANCWQIIALLSLLMIVILVVSLIYFFMKKESRLNRIANEIDVKFKWNIVIILFCSYLGDIVFFGSLEFMTFALFGNTTDGFSMIAAIILNALIIILVFRIMQVIKAVKAHQTSNTNYAQQKWQRYAMVFDSFKATYYIQRLFILLFILRILFFYNAITYLYNYPLAQAIIITLTSLLMTLYLILLRPHLSIINQAQYILFETGIFVFNVCVLILAILDTQEREAKDFRANIGDVMLVVNVIINSLSLLFVGLKASLLAYDFIKGKGKGVRQNSRQKSRLPVRLSQKVYKKELIVNENSQNQFDISFQSRSQDILIPEFRLDGTDLQESYITTQKGQSECQKSTVFDPKENGMLPSMIIKICD